MTCAFCSDPATTGTIVHADESGWVILHDDWTVRGHAMIVARRHVENPSGLDRDEWLRFAELWQRAERALLELTGCERAIAMKLGIATPHLHIHLYPFAATASREEVFAAIDGRVSCDPDPDFVARLRQRLGSG